MSVYTSLEFSSERDFLAYVYTLPRMKLKLEPENVALSKEGLNMIVLMKTELPMPTGLLVVKTKGGREITIKVSSSGSPREVPEEKFP